MGLDDFAPATSSATKPNVNLDEDLFDFPPMEIPEPPQAPEPEPVAASPTAEAVSDDLDVGGDTPAAAVAPAAAQPAVQGCTGLDPELDHDLFGFPPMDLSSVGLNADGSPCAPPAIATAGPAAAVQDLLEDNLSDIMRDAHVEQKKAEAAQAQVPAPVAPAPAPAPAPAAVSPAAAAPVQPPLASAPLVMGGVAVAAPPSKIVWVLTVASILFMLGLLGIAWRATSSVQQQIQSVQGDVQSTVLQMQAERQANRDELLRLEKELLRTQAQAAQVNGTPKETLIDAALAAPHEIVLQVAHDSISNGRYEDARRMLFALLAESDHMSPETREKMEREASFLIAFSHKAQAASRPTDQ